MTSNSKTDKISPYLMNKEDTCYIVATEDHRGYLFCWSEAGHEYPLWARGVAERIIDDLNKNDRKRGANRNYKIVSMDQYYTGNY